jgi:serine/threonine protein kinase
VGHCLQGLHIQQLLSAGGTTLVYRAFDNASGRSVVLKEYLPAALARRSARGHVQLLSPVHAQRFERGLQAFLNEARLLSAVQHPSLVSVLRSWQQDGTAYLVMPQASGATLQQWLAGLGTPPSEAWLRQLLLPLMGALEALHLQGGHHGDVSLHSIWLQFDNLAESYLGQEPQPLLLGFSAACRVLAADGAVPALHSGFGPIEQADGSITVRQGAWTDIYGLCAVLYAALAGRSPPPSLARMARDDMVSARKVGHGRYSPSFLAAVDAGLAVRPHERLQSIEDLRQRLQETAPAAAIDWVALAPGVPEATGAAPVAAGSAPMRALGLLRQPRRHRRLWPVPAVAGAVLLLLALAGAWVRS